MTSMSPAERAELLAELKQELLADLKQELQTISETMSRICAEIDLAINAMKHLLVAQDMRTEAERLIEDLESLHKEKDDQAGDRASKEIEQDRDTLRPIPSGPPESEA